MCSRAERPPRRSIVHPLVALALSACALSWSDWAFAQEDWGASSVPADASLQAPEPELVPDPLAVAPAPVLAPAPRLDPALPEPAAVAQALDVVRADPLLPGKRTEPTLRFKWKNDKKREREASPPTPLPDWWVGAVRWLNDAGRVLVWGLGAVLLAYVIWRLRDWVRERADAAAPPSGRLPSHVRDLDIRPETLPDRVGDAALALWRRGEHRAAMALLYRALLSRLVHDHAVPILASSTEGDCLALARQHLDKGAWSYVLSLIGAWQLAVYGGRLPADDEVERLCQGFDASLVVTTPAAAADARSAP